EKGLLEGRMAITMMRMPSIGNIDGCVERIKNCWKRHPEALVPMMAGIYLETRQPTNGPKSLQLLRMQAELFQLGADSPSLVIGLDRSSRFLAAKTQVELLRLGEAPAEALRKSCIQNVRQALSSPETSAAEISAYFRLAMELNEYDLGSLLVAQWEQK